MTPEKVIEMLETRAGFMYGAAREEMLTAAEDVRQLRREYDLLRAECAAAKTMFDSYTSSKIDYYTADAKQLTLAEGLGSRPYIHARANREAAGIKLEGA